MPNEKTPPPEASTEPPPYFDEVELHDRLVTYENTEFTYNDEVERPLIEIVDDDVIAINGIRLWLTRRKRFIFNRLRISQGYAQTSTELRLGFYGNKDRFNEAMDSLVRSIRAASEEPIIARERVVEAARGTTYSVWSYALLPEVKILDIRSSLTSRERLIQGAVELDDEGRPRQHEDGRIMFKAPRHRKAVATQMLKEFRADLPLTGRLPELFKGAGARRTFDRPIPQLPKVEQLTIAQEDELLLRRERGLAAYVLGSEELSEEEKASIEDGIQAIFELFDNNLGVIPPQVRKHAWGRKFYADLYQNGALELFELVLDHPYESREDKPSFRLIAAIVVKRSLGEWIVREFTPYAGIYALRERGKMIDAIEVLGQRGGKTPDIAALAEYLSISEERTLTLLQLNKLQISFDAPEYGGGTPLVERLGGEEFVDEELNRSERERVIDQLFTDDILTTNEKIVLSIVHKLFHPSLRGATIQQSGILNDFVYPHAEEDFEELVKGRLDLTVISTEILKKDKKFAWRTKESAFRKARDFLSQYPLFDMYGRHKGLKEEDEQKRREIVEKALHIKSDGPLETSTIIALNREGIFVSTSKIIELWGSMPNFQKACGFEPADKRSQVRELSNDEILASARRARPNKEWLRIKDIKKLHEEGVLVAAWSTILSRYKSVKAFNAACGFTKKPKTTD